MTKAEREIVLEHVKSANRTERIAYGDRKHDPESDARYERWREAAEICVTVQAIALDLQIKPKYIAEAQEAGRWEAFRFFDRLGWADARDAL